RVASVIFVILLSCFAATLGALLASVVFALFEMGGELIEAEGIEHAVFRDCALAGHQYAPPDIVDLVRRMGVGIDAEQTPQVKTAFAPAPVQIEPPRDGIELDGDAVLGAGCKDLLHVHFVAGASQQLPPMTWFRMEVCGFAIAVRIGSVCAALPMRD
ncbi:MAG TPA: hypothetical protein VJQ25_07970, partial [Nitrospira sp.]|nr:hypothetical protein [Nitrospira sp.]